MSDGDLIDLTIAVDRGGDAHVMEAPDGFRVWGTTTTDTVYDNHLDGFDGLGLPTLAGVYNVILEFKVEGGDAANDPDGYFILRSIEHCRVMPSGCVLQGDDPGAEFRALNPGGGAR